MSSSSSSFFLRFLQRIKFNKRPISQMTKQDKSLKALFTRYIESVGFAKRTISQTAVRMKELTDPMELATGVFKRELLLKKAGCDDPWQMSEPLKKGKGTCDCPTQIPSAFEGRLIGCICLGDRCAKFMWLEKGAPKRCECGHFFVLKYVPPV